MQAVRRRLRATQGDPGLPPLERWRLAKGTYPSGFRGMHRAAHSACPCGGRVHGHFHLCGGTEATAQIGVRSDPADGTRQGVGIAVRDDESVVLIHDQPARCGADLRVVNTEDSVLRLVGALAGASAESDLLVVASRGADVAQRLGSAAEGIAQLARCSVLVVRDPSDDAG